MIGYQRLHILLRRYGITINRKKTQRLHREEDLTMCRRKGRKCAVGARAPAPVLALPNQRWSLDFGHDQMATGRRLSKVGTKVSEQEQPSIVRCRLIEVNERPKLESRSWDPISHAVSLPFVLRHDYRPLAIASVGGW